MLYDEHVPSAVRTVDPLYLNWCSGEMILQHLQLPWPHGLVTPKRLPKASSLTLTTLLRILGPVFLTKSNSLALFLDGMAGGWGEQWRSGDQDDLSFGRG